MHVPAIPIFNFPNQKQQPVRIIIIIIVILIKLTTSAVHVRDGIYALAKFLVSTLFGV